MIASGTCYFLRNDYAYLVFLNNCCYKHFLQNYCVCLVFYIILQYLLQDLTVVSSVKYRAIVEM